MVCAIADEKGTILDRKSIPTLSPAETIPPMVEYFKQVPICALGIACFGPLDLNKKSAAFGCIQKTPKKGWADVNVIKPFQDALGIPVGIDTDVNGAALGEVVYGAAQGLDSVVYMTIGTGIGAGVYVEGKLLHGMQHPEVGHILLQRHPDDSFSKGCPFHTNCLEGFASGPAIQKRWGKPAIELYDVPEVWELEAYYLAQAVSNLVLCYSPQRVILGGGVMHKPGLTKQIHQLVLQNLNGYIQHPLLEREDYIVMPGCGDNAGVLGAIEIGKLAWMGE